MITDSIAARSRPTGTEVSSGAAERAATVTSGSGG
jgi:hypothetical protein